MRLHARILQSGPNTTGIEVPDEVVEALGSGRGRRRRRGRRRPGARHRPREVTVPPDLAAALDAEPAARATFDGLSYSNRSWHVLQVTGAKTEETRRRRRIARSVEALKQGRPR